MRGVTETLIISAFLKIYILVIMHSNHFSFVYLFMGLMTLIHNILRKTFCHSDLLE